VNTFSVENRTRTYQPRQGIYLRRGPGDDQFDCQLPEEARTELEEIPPPQTYRLREIPTLRPAQEPPPEVFFRPPPPVSPPGLPVTPGAARPAQRAPRSGTGIWLLLGVLLGLPVLISLLPHATSTLRRSSSRSVDDTQPQSRPVEVRRALPGPVEVRRALPVVPRALPVTAPVSLAPDPQIGQWQPVRLLDGTTVQVCYQGELPSSAALPVRGRFIGEEWSTGNTSWIWMTPAGVNFPSWVDP
jgi:hypothetical protein